MSLIKAGLLVAFAAGMASLPVGCSDDKLPNAGYDNDGGGGFGGVATGPCETGQSRKCGIKLAQHDDIVTCYMGTQTCESGTWGDCTDGTQTMKSVAAPPGVGPGSGPMNALTNCAGNPCDPYCQNLNDDAGLTADPAQAIDSACAGNRAFVANGAAYVYPTPPALASALGALTYDASSHPITLVLAVASDGTAVTAASASPDPESGSSRSFPDSMKPDLTPALVKAGGFATTTQQQDAWLAFSDASGEKYLRLGNLAFSATTSAGCTTAMVSLTAVIPASEAGLSLELPSGTTTVGALAGPSNGGAWDLKLLFTAASADFDFGST